MSKKTALILTVFLAAAILVLSIFSLLRLPDRVVVQVDAGGNPGNTLSKPFALLIPLGITGMGCFFLCKDRNAKGLFMGVMGILVSLMALVFNA